MNMKNKIFILFAVLIIGSGYAQNHYVSQPIANAMKTGKFYMKMAGTQGYTENDNAVSMQMQIETALHNGVNMSRTKTQGTNMVILTTSSGCYMLNEAAKTWQFQPNAGANPAFTNLKFKRQGTCKVNGKEGWFFDEYYAGNNIFSFYYQSDKVAIIDLGGQDEDAMGPMHLHSFNATIPSSMYFCVGNDWKPAGSNSVTATAGIDRAAIEKQIRDGLKGQQLPPGMTIDDLVNKAMKNMGGAKTAPSTAPKPPTCSTPWKDSTSGTELACGNGYNKIIISDKRTLTTPVYAENLAPAASSAPARTDLNVTENGIKQALKKLQSQIADMNDNEISDYIMKYNNDIMCAFRANAITGDLIEEAIAHAIAYPNALTLNNIGIIYLYKDEAINALPYFESALKYDNNNPTVLANLAESYFEQNKLDEAEKYAKQCLAIAPQFGSALQVMTSIYFSRGKHIEGMTWLLKTAPHYFTDITASQFNSLWMAIEELKALGGQGYDVKPYFDKIYTPENLALLEEATKAGFEHHYLETAMGNRQWNWPVKTTVEFSWKYYQKCAQQMAEKENEMQLYAKECANRKGSLLNLYSIMGAGSVIGNMSRIEHNMQQVINAKGGNRAANITGQQPNTDITNLLPDQEKINQAYLLESKLQSGDNDGQILYDARQYWCLKLWQQLFQMKMKYEQGQMCTTDKNGNLIGYFPSYYADYLTHEKNLNKELAFADEKRDRRIEPENNKRIEELKALEKKSSNMSAAQYDAAKKAIDIAYYSRLEEIMQAWYGEKKQIELERLGNFHRYYTQHYQPVMESYWKKMNQMCVWCNSKDVIDYYLYMAEAENIRPVTQAFEHGSDIGGSIYSYYQQWRAIREAIDEHVEDLKEEVAELDMQIAQEGTHPNGCSKYPCDITAGVDLVAREFSVTLNKDGKFLIDIKNKETGSTITHNLTDHTCTSKELYVVTPQEKADALANAQKVRQNLYTAIGNEALGLAIGKIPGAMSKIMEQSVNVGTAAERFHTVDNTRQRYITQDGAGNILGARKTLETSTTHTYSYGNVSISHTTSQSDLLTGGAKNKQYHVRAAYKIGFIQISSH